MVDALNTISPLDGRYQNKAAALRPFFSEMALMRYRVLVEIEYLIALSRHPHVDIIQELSPTVINELRSLYNGFTSNDAKEIKQIESTTRHDVKAIEYYLQRFCTTRKLPIPIQAIHFALTSEDVNNISFTLMWKDAIHTLYLPTLHQIIQTLSTLAKTHANTPMLSLTHGQSATPTTFGKEMMVFARRLSRLQQELLRHPFMAKCNGATGTWAAHVVSYPNTDWRSFSAHLIRALGLFPNEHTTQIEPHDSLARSYHGVIRLNTVLIDLCRDMWSYISRGILMQKKKNNEVGSSTMPHKVNPIDFENGEGNFGLSSAIAGHMAQKLPISRMQRDLSDSTVLRNQGVLLGHSYIGMQSVLTGLGRTDVHYDAMVSELQSHPEVLAEAVQTVLRRYGITDAYERIKEATRGTAMTLEQFRELVKTLPLPEQEKDRLLRLTPEQYIGLAANLVE